MSGITLSIIPFLTKETALRSAINNIKTVSGGVKEPIVDSKKIFKKANGQFPLE